MKIDLPDHSDATNRQISPRSIDWWHQPGLGGPGTLPIRAYAIKKYEADEPTIDTQAVGLTSGPREQPAATVGDEPLRNHVVLGEGGG